MEPLEAAVSCLGQAKLVVSPGGQSNTKVAHAWALNGTSGLARNGLHLDAQMQYEFTQGAVSGQWRVRTVAYRYKLSAAGTDVFRLHWHPNGTSTYKEPHLHVSLGPTDSPYVTHSDHLATPRMTLEDAIDWSIRAGMPAARQDWEQVLAETRELHKAHRSWG